MMCYFDWILLSQIERRTESITTPEAVLPDERERPRCLGDAKASHAFAMLRRLLDIGVL
jgi:hypothetical protein